MNAGPDRKIIPIDQLAQHVRELRAAGKTIVQCHGCFDLVHPGHVRYLRFARQLGDELLVSVTGDSGMSKGPARPFIPQELRAENLAALEFVSMVVIDPHPTACELLQLVQPDVYVKGREYAGSSDPRFRRESEIVQSYGGRVVFHSGDVVFSSTRLLQSLERDAQLDETRLRTLCERGKIDRSAITRVLDAFESSAALVVGDAIRERYVLCDQSGPASDAPLMTLQALDVREFWGGAAAIALQLAALGIRTRFVTCTAEGADGDRLVRELSAAGVDVRIVRTQTELPRQTTFVADEAKLFRVTHGGAAPLDTRREQDALAAIREKLSRETVAIWCDAGYGAISPTLVREAARLPCRSRLGCTAAGAGDLLQFDGFDLLAAPERRLRDMLHDTADGLPVVAWKLLQSTGGGAAHVSLHKRGAVTFSGRDPLGNLPDRLASDYVPALANQWIDRLGVEEAIVAALGAVAATFDRDADLARWLPTASYLAASLEALVGGKAGRAVVSESELRDWIDMRPELHGASHFLPEFGPLAEIAMVAPPLSAVEK